MREGAHVLNPRPFVLPDVAAEERSRLRGLAFVLLAVAALWLLAASRWITTDTVVPWDAKNQFYAFFRFLAAAIHAGDAPFWNPYHYGGHPSVADPQSLVFAPAFVLWALFDPAPSIRAFDLIVYAHLLIGGLAVGGDRVARGLAGGGLHPCRRCLHVRRSGGRPPAAHRHHPELRTVPAGAAAHAAGDAAPLDPVRGGLRRGRRHAGAGTQPRGAAAVLRARRHPRRRDRVGARAGTLPASAHAGPGHHGGGRRGPAGRAAAAHHAVRGPLQPARGPAGQGAGGFPLPCQSRLAGRRQHHGLAGEHASLLGSQLRHPAGSRRHRPLLQLPVRRLRHHGGGAVVRRRRRRPDPARLAR